MIIYQATKKEFINDCKQRRIADAVKKMYEKNLGKAHKSEVIAWENSLTCMANVIDTPLMWIDKAQTWEMADKFGRLDYVRKNTLTCYNGIMGDGCGECPACKLRKRGLDKYLASKENR